MDQRKDSILKEPSADYEKAEMDLLKSALRRSHTERFHMMAELMKMNQMFRKAKIKHKRILSSE